MGSFTSVERRAGHRACPAPKSPLASEIGGGFAECLLDATRLPNELRIARHEHRRCAADVRRRHAGAIEFSPSLIGKGRADTLPGCDQIGLESAVASGSAAGEKTHSIGMGPEAVRGSDRDHSIGVSGVGDAESGIAIIATLLGFEALVAKVSGSSDDDDAIFHQPLALIADGRAPAGKISDIVRNREA